MHSSYVTKAYRTLVTETFKELLLSIRYVSPNVYPDIERARQTLTRFRDENPILADGTVCDKGLPDTWVILQFTRSALGYESEQDEFRTYKIRENNEDLIKFTEGRWGFGYYDLQFWLLANNEQAIEMAETLFYRRLYKIQTFSFDLLDIRFTVEVVHEPLQNFSTVQWGSDQENYSGFSVQFAARIQVPVLRDDIEGFLVLKNQIKLFSEELFHPFVNVPGQRTELSTATIAELDAGKTLLETITIQDGRVISEEIG